ncbi:MAG TPA: lysophospholipid acyltransferase family protein [Solirubrobacteraceae bacterium]|nr:lysophospholipid acyltransferase family protein [Solirubrobacteraceae bacterium]
MENEAHHVRARTKGVNIVVYWLIRTPLQVFFHVYLRMSRLGREHIPQQGPAIIAANHRSFFDPFIIGTMARRPMYYVAKRELFEIHPVLSWLVGTLGAFPVDRGRGDQDTIATAKQLLARGELVLIFPEGTRTRPGPLGSPRRGVGRLALESGAPVIPVAIIGTEAIRRGWRLRPHKVRVRAGRLLQFPHVDVTTPAAAAAVTERVWACVKLQWAWLGGTSEPEPISVREAVRAA